MRVAAAVLASLALGVSAASAGTPSGTFLSPVWSPDGTQIAWEAVPGVPGSSYSEQIWTAAPDGSGARLVKGHIDSLLQLDWPAPGLLLYDANYELFGLGSDGRTHLLAKSAGFSFSRDAAGERIAWGSVGCGFCHGPVVVLDRSTGRRVSIGGKRVYNGGPTLSPDGSRVAFTRSLYDKKSGEYGRFIGLWVANTDGTHLHRVSTDGYCASWSPDGGALAYIGFRATELRTMSPDGGPRRVLLAKGAVCGEAPARWAWSPDSKSIALIDSKSDRLSVLDVATTSRRTISTFAHVTGFAWSPDSTQLLVSSRPSPSACSSLWRIGADGTSAQLVAHC
jgi:Tol biopolymer transport system component